MKVGFQCIRSDQGFTRKCYKVKLKMKKRLEKTLPGEVRALKINLVDLDPREDPTPDSLAPMGDLKKIQIETI